MDHPASPEDVAANRPPLEPASLLRRAVAFLLDVLLLQIPVLIWILLPGTDGMAGWAVTIAALGLVLLYFTACEALWGATLGKRLLRTQVVSASGGALDWKASALRNVLRLVDGLPMAYVLGGVVALASPLRQRIGDRAARTVVVRMA